MVEKHVDKGADVNAEKGEYTPLMTAAEAGDVEMVRLLINSGANVNMSNNFQDVELVIPNTALMAASHRGHLEVARLLIEAGADVNYRGADGYTALDWPISWGWGVDCRKTLETAIVLVQGGADGQRFLSLVREEWCGIGYRFLSDELAKFLHEAGAANPRGLALGGDYSEIAEYLKNWKSVEKVPAE